MRKRQDKERRRLTEEIVETNHGAYRMRIMSQSLLAGKGGGLGGKDDDDKNKDLNETK